MKRLSRNKIGEVSYGQKWQNTESENDDDLHSPTITAAHEDKNKDQIPKGKRFEVSVKDGDLMYIAALQGDWIAAEVLLERDRKLTFEYITEEGDRALHVAAAMKHKEFVKKLVGRMSEEELVLQNGQGCSACCYAATSGKVEIARLIIEKSPNLVTARDEENATPLRKAALQGNGTMLKFLLGYTKGEDLSREEWFDILLVAIRGEMFGAAIDILGKNGSIAMMATEEGTAMHLMARVDASREMNIISLLLELPMKMLPLERDDDYGKEYYPREFRELAEKLWDEMQKMEKASLLELIKKPVHIIHEAAKAGQVKIITMLARTFPNLVWETDSNGYTMFHLAVMYRRTAVFNLVHQVEAMLGLRTTWQDQQGNNILHLAAAKSAAFNQIKLPPAHQMQRELKFFKAVKKIVPPSCLMMRNGEGVTPGELFSQTHKKLLKESEVWMINKADSLMLIATILLTVVFAAAFTVPGGYAQTEPAPAPVPAPAPASAPAPAGDVIKIGEPVLAKKAWFIVFVISEMISLVFSLLSIMIFQYIMTSRFAQEEFLFPLPLLQWVGFQTMFISLAGASLAFMAAISLYSMKGTNALKWVGIGILLLYGSVWALRELTSWNRHTSDKISDCEDTLFQQKVVKKRFNMKKNITTWMEFFLISCNKFHQRERNFFRRIGAKKNVLEAAQVEQLSNLM